MRNIFLKNRNTIETIEKLEDDEEQQYAKTKCEFYEKIFKEPEKYLVDKQLDEFDILDILENDMQYQYSGATESKVKFFELYENIKNGKEKIDKLALVDIIKIKEMLKQEIILKSGDIHNLDINEIQTEANMIKEQNKMLLEELKALQIS